jgi:hypothetical protein
MIRELVGLAVCPFILTLFFPHKNERYKVEWLTNRTLGTGLNPRVHMSRLVRGIRRFVYGILRLVNY